MPSPGPLEEIRIKRTIAALCIALICEEMLRAQFASAPSLTLPQGFSSHTNALDQSVATALVPADLSGVSFQNVRVTPHSAIQDETFIAVNPVNLSNLILVCMDWRGGGPNLPGQVYANWSTDGGSTWATVPVNKPAYMDRTGDPALTFDADGRVFYAYLANDNGSSQYQIDNGVYVNVSSDGGMSWGPPIAVAENLGTGSRPFDDRIFLATDLTSGPHHNTVYACWSRKFPALVDHIYFSRKTSTSATFTTPVQISDASAAASPVPTVGPDGTVYVAWLREFGNLRRMMIDKSTDGGVTFGTDVVIDYVIRIGTVITIGGQTLPRLKSTFVIWSLPSIAVDQVSGTVYAVWADARHGDPDILLLKSTDRGGTWSPSLRVNTDTLGNGKDQWHPWVTVGPEGNVYVVYSDSRNDPNNILTDIYIAVSRDGGTTFRDFRVNTQTFNPLTGDYPYFIGDYNCVVATSSTVISSWTDMRSGYNSDAYIALVPVSLVHVPDKEPSVPSRYVLHQNFPNPFNPATRIRFDVPKESFISLKLYNLLGQEIRVLLSEMRSAGTHEVLLDPSGLSSGVYLVRLQAEGVVLGRKLLLTK